jgi:hypothetical protein
LEAKNLEISLLVTVLFELLAVLAVRRDDSPPIAVFFSKNFLLSFLVVFNSLPFYDNISSLASSLNRFL